LCWGLNEEDIDIDVGWVALMAMDVVNV